MLCFVLLSACGKADKPVTVELTSEMPVKLNEEHKDSITRISGVFQKDGGLYFALYDSQRNKYRKIYKYKENEQKYFYASIHIL